MTEIAMSQGIADIGVPAAASSVPTSSRLRSLDVFRGLNIILMLIVNNIALDIYQPAQLSHAGWNKGMFVTDWVFPWFLLMVGLSIPVSEAAARKRGLTDHDMVLRIWKRGGMIFLWGLIVSSALEHRPVFTLGVLQLIAMAFVAGSFLMRLERRRMLQVCFALLLIYFLAVRILPYPGGSHFDESNNLLKFINDRWLAEPFRIAGLLSVIPTAPLVVMGVLATEWISRRDIGDAEKVGKLVVAAGALILVGHLLSFILPYNKPVWTPPYILTSAGLGLLVLAILVEVIEVRGIVKWTIEIADLGSNALLAYVLPILVKMFWFKAWTIPAPKGRDEMHTAILLHLKAHLGPMWGGAIYTALYVGFWWWIVVICTRRGWFLKA